MIEDISAIDFSSPIHREIVTLVLYFLEREERNAAVNLAAAGLALDLVGLYLHEVSAHLDDDGLAEKISQFRETASADDGERIMAMARRLPMAKVGGRAFAAGVLEFMPPRLAPKRESGFGFRLLQAYTRSFIPGKLAAPMELGCISWHQFESFRKTDLAFAEADHFLRHLLMLLKSDTSLAPLSFAGILNTTGQRLENRTPTLPTRKVPDLFMEDRFAGRFRLVLLLFALYMVHSSTINAEKVNAWREDSNNELQRFLEQYYPTGSLGNRLRSIPLLARMIASWLVHPRSLPTLTRGFGPVE